MMAPSKSTAPTPIPNGVAAPPETLRNGEPLVNRKKQKKRQKQAARMANEPAASQSSSESRQPTTTPRVNGVASYPPADYDDRYESRDGEDLFYSEEDGLENVPHPPATSSKSKKKKKNQTQLPQTYAPSYSQPTVGHFHPPPPPPPPPLENHMSTTMMAKDRIWNTSTAEERERIKEFWLSLEETDRRSLVKVEKEAVLKKMKEQQKHSCSCSVCGRKRNAIEEELEVLYDAYYEELEHYANHQQLALGDGSSVMPPPSAYHSMINRLPLRPSPRVPTLQHAASTRMAGSFVEEDEEDEPPYSDEEVSEDDYYPPEPTRGPAADFFQFGNSLTVDRGILTVADDLLQNDGKKFIEMMEQLAERRMQREEEATYAPGLRHPAMDSGQGPPPLDEEDYDDEVEDDYASEDEEDYDEEEAETMTEEARMEEGRRMFQIFAARMFEQRVLTAYREKVARERQEKLLEELADEDRQDAQREAKKAKEAQKKKDKKRQQKAAKEEERLKKDAERAAEEAAVKEAEERRLDEQRQKKDEQRKKREAERRAQEEEKQRKESEKQRRLQEARDQQAENERKQRELKEKDKRRKEEAKKREREEKEAREKERKDRELAEKQERDAKERTEKEARQRTRKGEKARKDEAVVPAVQEAPTLQPPPAKKTGGAAPPGLGPLPANHISPHPQIATPIIPKAPTPMRPRQASNQGSHQSSPRSAQLPLASAATSPSSTHTSQVPAVPASGPPKGPQALSLSQAPGPSMIPPGIFSDAVGMANSPEGSTPGFSPYHGPMMPGAVPRGPNAHDALMYSQQPFSAPPHRAFHNPNPLAYPPGMNSMTPAHHGRASPVHGPSNQAPIGSGVAPPGLVSSSHARQTSMDLPTQPMSRLNPIQRPSSTPQNEDTKADAEPSHLGSSALLDDADETLGARATDARGPIAPVGQRPARLGLGASPVFSDALGSAKMENFRGWGAPSMPFGASNAPHPPTWPNATAASRPHMTAIGGHGGSNRQLAKPVQLRLLMCEACRRLNPSGPDNNGAGREFHSIQAIVRQMEQLRPASEPQIQVRELVDIVDTEGNAQNGGGTFMVDGEGPHMYVRYMPDGTSGGGMGRFLGGHGDIGSPVTSSAVPFGTPRGLGRSGGGIPAPGF